MSRRWTLGIAAAGAAGVVIALAVVRLGVGETAASRVYVNQPEYAVWGGLVLLQVPMWTVLAVLSAAWASEVRALPPINDRPTWHVAIAWLGSSTLIGVLIAAQQVAMHVEYPRVFPDDLVARIIIMAAIAALAAGVPAVALWGLHRAAAAIDPGAPGAVDRFSMLWSRQRDFLVVLSVMLAVAILTTAARIQANNGFAPPGRPALPEVPATYILVQGALYGAIMLVLYLPPYYFTRRVGDRLVAAACSTTDPELSEGWFKVREERDRWRTALGLQEGAREHLQRGVILLAPLLTALVTTLLPGVRT